MNMNKPDFILIRHSESVGNVDPQAYFHAPDHLIPLSEKGRIQCCELKDQLFNLLLNYSQADRWVSPYTRTKQTAEYSFPNRNKSLSKERVDPRLREQEWGLIGDLEQRQKMREDRKKVGHFFYRFPNGESGADVYDRCSMWLESVFRNEYTENAVNVVYTHGMTMRVLAMRLLHVDYTEFETWDNPENCGIILLKHDGMKYTLDSQYTFKKWK